MGMDDWLNKGGEHVIICNQQVRHCKDMWTDMRFLHVLAIHGLQWLRINVVLYTSNLLSTLEAVSAHGRVELPW